MLRYAAMTNPRLGAPSSEGSVTEGDQEAAGCDAFGVRPADPADPADSPRERARTVMARMEEILRAQHYSARTVEAYLGWVRRFLGFHRPLDVRALGAESVRTFLTALAVRRHVAAATQNQARSALVFLFRHVLRAPLPPLEGVPPAYRPRRLPVVLSRDEVAAVLRELSGAKRLVAMLLYGSGLRLLEALTLG